MKGRTEKEKTDKLDDATYLTIRGFRERNIVGKKNGLWWKGFTNGQKSQG